MLEQIISILSLVGGISTSDIPRPANLDLNIGPNFNKIEFVSPNTTQDCFGIKKPLVFNVPIRDNYKQRSGFGYRRHPVTGKKTHHDGIDYGAPTGTSVYSSAPGIVGRVERKGGYGRTITVRHGLDKETFYAHLAKTFVQPGDIVNEYSGPIATVGSSGLSTGPHLHFEYRVNGTQVDPKSILKSNIPSKLPAITHIGPNYSLF